MSDAVAVQTPLLNNAGWRPRLSSGWVGGLLLLMIALPCFVTLPWSLGQYNEHNMAEGMQLRPPSWSEPMGTDLFGQSVMWRSLLGGAISLTIGGCAALISVFIGVTWGATAGYIGGRVDSAMMRVVDVLYGLPYILLVVLMNLALKPFVYNGLLWVGEHVSGSKGNPLFNESSASGMSGVVTLLLAIGGVSWLTMARVIRGQVLSLRSQPFMEAARAVGTGHVRTMLVHLLPNLIGPIVVYATLTVPQAILQESFLSFLGIGVEAPIPSWGNLASEGLPQLHKMATHADKVEWWLLLFPCLLLGMTLMGLNFLGDALRNRLDPKRAKT